MSFRLLFSSQKSNPEFQSALVRLGIWLFMLFYIGLGAATDYFSVQMEQYYTLFTVFLVIFVLMLISVLVRPVWLERQYLGLAIDVVATSYSVVLTQNVASPIFLFYIWIFVSYGTRYGKDHLIAAALVSMMAYTAVMVQMGGWRNYTFESSFFLLLLGLLPIYQYSLLKKLHDAKLEAERATATRGRFLATMTHELRTPLSGLIGMSKIMDTNNLSVLQLEQLTAIRQSADRLHRLIGDVLDFSKIDADKLELETRPFDFVETVLTVCQTLALQATDKGVEILFSVAEDVPFQVFGDSLRVSQIFTNLVANAIKFTDKGQIKVSILVEDCSKEEIHFLVQVADTGIGIPEKQLLSVFDAFRQVDESNARRFEGAGLGMAISNNLVLLMNGVIDVESQLGKGSLFSVHLPFHVAQWSLPEIQAIPKKQVLLLESEESQMKQAKAMLASMGLDVIAMKNIRELTHLSLAQAIDVVVLADSIHGRKIIDAGHVIFEILGKTVPIVFLTYPGRNIGRLPPHSMNVNKPYSFIELHDAIEQVLSFTDETLTKEEDNELWRISHRRKRILVAEDDHINAQLISTLLGREGHQVDVYSDGFTALQGIRMGHYDMAFIDLRMPDMDGVELARIIRNDRAAIKDIPLFAITANISDDIQQACDEAGMNEFLVKPISLEVIHEVIEKYS